MAVNGQPYGVLTKREKEFLTHVNNGLSRREIVEKMQISLGTAQRYAKLCNQKMLTSNAPDAARVAKQIGQI